MAIKTDEKEKIKQKIKSDLRKNRDKHKRDAEVFAAQYKTLLRSGK